MQGSVMTGRLVIVRHGAHANEGFLACHRSCRGLSDEGRRQAWTLRDRLESSRELDRPVAVYTSVLRRVVETAEVVVPALRFGGRVRERCDLCELHCGEADGLSEEEWRARFGEHPGLLAEPERPIASNGESWLDLMDRAGGALNRLVGEHPEGTTVVFTSTGVVAASMVSLGGVDARSPITLPAPFTSITEWSWRGGEPPRLRTYGDAAHLLRRDGVGG